MANYIGCRNCDPLYCDNCNIYILATMLREGKLDCLMDERHCITIDPASLRPKGEWTECDWVKYDGHGECIHYPKEALRCSNCCNAFKKKLLWKRNFCPNCGADMRGETHDS